MVTLVGILVLSIVLDVGLVAPAGPPGRPR